MGAFAQIQVREGITLPPLPAVEAIPIVDDYFGTKIVDNYRWLEDAKSPQTRAFLSAQNVYTASYLKQASTRPRLVEDLKALENISRWSMPIVRAGNYFFLKRLAGEEQASIYLRRGWTGKDERLVDPAVLSRDPNTSVSMADVSRDGTLLAYRVRQGGADQTSVHLLNVKTGKPLADELPSARYDSVRFAPDGAGFYYARNDKTGTLLYLHLLGKPQDSDTLLFGREFHGEKLGPNDLFSGDVTDDGRYLVVQINRGVPARRVDIVFRDLSKQDAPFEILVWGLDSRFSTIYAMSTWFVRTDDQAPNGRILKAQPGIQSSDWKTIVPEAPNVIDGFSIVGGKLYVMRLKDVKYETSIYTPEGKPAGHIDYDGIGSASGLFGRPADRYGFYSFYSFIQPPTIYRLDTVTGKREVFAEQKIPFDSSQYEMRQVFFKSKDGARIPMFIAGKKGLKQDGTERLLMTGYGGFNLSETPTWNPAYAWWMEQGGWFALPNLRGGGEYGESWHQQAMFEKKQNIFDDWFAAAEYLIDNKYTSAARFAIRGRSNGGLLMGASITQRPDLFSAVWCGYPLLDMLRYQKFLVGSYWKTEYGTAENETQFRYLLKYSPYHNVKAGTPYPAVMFFTGDNDTRVDPLHARKMTALLQPASSSERPILLHYSLSGGHSAGVGAEQQIQDDADELTFLWTETAQLAVAQPSIPQTTLWRFDRIDSIGGHPATVLGHPHLIDSPYGKAVEFNGIDDALFVPAHPLAAAPAFTWEVIFRPDAGGAEAQRFFHLQEVDPTTGQDTPNRMLFEIRIVNGQWCLDSFATTNGQARTLLNCKLLHPLGKWYRVTAVYDGKTFSNYVDGELQGSGELQLAPQLPGRSSIGTRINKTFYFKGAVLRSRMTPRALPPDQFLEMPAATRK
jgi:prolyl oligopeptidase